MAGRWHPEHGPEGFLGVTADQARLVLDVEEGWPTYDAGLEFQGLAMSAMSDTPEGEYLPDIPTALNLIWGALTDEMDAPGRGSPDQDAAAVRHMKQAAAEWLAVVYSRVDRAAYLDHWVHDECGYQRMAPESSMSPQPGEDFAG
ncbi:hypothetical protein [Micromonospora sp. U21]|uniref:hypothetical protein n=1 Tax=Micromonospora sp. U21 TaxID=2824899 RepID=UPI001B378DB2|nr:hypothetical protein [Micromonospora sp. U21]MBQ0905283.1 hypothetical protein [Micromonospora sp. U21]